ncbi:MAG TPA: GNAT family N-acetyltransferase [Candidatus Saccharimonadia bacterium]|jgi:aminoglycoside 6'-N-acetyltransferase I
MSNLTLRRLQAADPDLAQIAAELNAGDNEMSSKTFTAESLREFLSNPDHFYLIATSGGQIAGATHGYLHVHPAGPRYLYIDEVDTVKQFRRQGVATAMMHEAFNVGRELGVTEVWLGTENDNEPAKALYLSLRPSEIEHGPIYTYKVKEK